MVIIIHYLWVHVFRMATAIWLGHLEEVITWQNIEAKRKTFRACSYERKPRETTLWILRPTRSSELAYPSNGKLVSYFLAIVLRKNYRKSINAEKNARSCKRFEIPFNLIIAC